MSEQHDGLDVPMEQAFQHGMTLAAQIGTELSQTLQMFRERQAKADGAQAALMQAQFNAERSTAIQALSVTSDPKWWDAASRDEVVKAFEVSTAWKDHVPEAAVADQRIRDEVVTRYRIDPETLPMFDVPGARKQFGANPTEEVDHSQAVNGQETSSPTLTDQEQKQAAALRWEQLQQAEDWLRETDPERSADFRHSQLGYNEHGGYDFDMKVMEDKLLADWRTATGQELPAAEKQATANGERAKEEQAHALVERAEAATAQREERDELTAARNSAPEEDGPNVQDEAWFAAQLAESLEPAQAAQETQSKIHEQVAESQGHEQVAETAGNTAGAKWDSAERREALATELRSKAVPDEAITARLHAERQHAHPISASVGDKAQAAQKTKTGPNQGQTRTLKKQL